MVKRYYFSLAPFFEVYVFDNFQQRISGPVSSKNIKGIVIVTNRHNRTLDVELTDLNTMYFSKMFSNFVFYSAPFIYTTNQSFSIHDNSSEY